MSSGIWRPFWLGLNVLSNIAIMPPVKYQCNPNNQTYTSAQSLTEKLWNKILVDAAPQFCNI